VAAAGGSADTATGLSDRPGRQVSRWAAAGAWSQLPRQAVLLPILPNDETGRAAILVVGLNPFRLIDEGYRGFLELAAGQIAATIANAQAYEEERRRAQALE
jgi:hypothetical protein